MDHFGSKIGSIELLPPITEEELLRHSLSRPVEMGKGNCYLVYGPHHHNVTKSLSSLSYTYHTIASPLQQQLNYLGGDGSSRQVQVDRMSTSCLRSNRRRLDSLLVFGVSAAQGNFFNLLIHSARPTTIGLAQPSHPHPSNNGGANFKL